MTIWNLLMQVWNGLRHCIMLITNNAITISIKIVNLKESPAYAFYSEAFRVQTMRAPISGS